VSDIQKTPNTLPWPPMIYLAAVAIAVILNWLYPLPWISRPLSELLFAIGWMMAAGAIAIDISAIRTMRRAKTTVMPHKGSDHLVTSGAFSFTRNPIYVGNTVLMLALGLISEIVWFLPLAFIAAYTTQKLAIEREEKHLEARFGKKWRDYAKKVRRWL
jgi:protein-S-isoprenylcysteine O-methyltransferase Ste14